MIICSLNGFCHFSKPPQIQSFKNMQCDKADCESSSIMVAALDPLNFEKQCNCCYTSCRPKSSTFCVVEAALANGRRNSLWALLLSQFLFKPCKLFHGNFFLLIEYLIDAFDLLNLRPPLAHKRSYEIKTTHIMHQHRLYTIFQSDCTRVARPTSAS